MEINVTATISLTFDTVESFVKTEEDAMTEMLEYIYSGPSPYEFDISVEARD